MRGVWLTLAFWWVAASAQAQPLADPGPVLEQPYLGCAGCQVPPTYYDPYGAEIAKLQRERPSRVGPILLLCGGALMAMAGTGMMVDPIDASDRTYGALALVGGVASVGIGAAWLRHRKRQRAEVDQQIVRLEQARWAGVPYAGAPPSFDAPVRYPRQASLAGPITITSVGAGLLAMGALMTTIAITGRFVGTDDLLALGILADAAGAGMVIGGGIWWSRRAHQRRAMGRLDVSGLPFRLRW